MRDTAESVTAPNYEIRPHAYFDLPFGMDHGPMCRQCTGDYDLPASQDVTVLSAEDVGWMMRQIQQAKSRMAEEDATGAALIARLHEEIVMVALHVTAASKTDADRIDYLEAQLTAHLLNKRAADPGVKSIRTPWGEVSSREQPAEFQRDDAELLVWLQVYGKDDWIRQKSSYAVAWDTIKADCHVRGDKLVTPEGEVLPGVTVVERPLKIVVKVAE
jgi:hypothetical protein